MEMASGFVGAINEVSRNVNSARPDAPVVPHVERPQRTRLVRLALAKGLQRAAQAIAPAERSPA
ncbi:MULTISPECIES: hypothetical protein [Micromonosporaceae]|uniref:hypothetical protein n=1 Tax=Micromonosporaceae TaxID=28056 RepID=UPI00248C1F23|nr:MULTISPECIES: hypothetical protein [unclassified Solwaraspora]WBB95611.1 hypothetical protein O7553_19810 [Solwaraspora sp. WMMA2059]WBC20483.1 hypothetical protein O7543_27555 [Solwaraspora sp. WMMA2080]